MGATLPRRKAQFPIPPLGRIFFCKKGGQGVTLVLKNAQLYAGGQFTRTDALLENGALVDYTPKFNMRPHFENEINAFVDCIKTGKKLPSHIDTVIITAKMMQAIYDSSEQHKEITLG